jgi:RNA polymerase sigma-70 factor (ECF subfamily)
MDSALQFDFTQRISMMWDIGMPKPEQSISPTSAGTPSLDLVVRENYADVYRYCLSLTGNAEDAADAVQQSFLSLTRSQDSVQQWDRIRSWLFTTAKRFIFRQLERKQKKQEISLEDDLIPESAFAIEDNILEKIDGDSAVAALQAVDITFREVLVLFYLQQLSYEEIATELGVPIGTVMSRLYRGKRKLADVFNSTGRPK